MSGFKKVGSQDYKTIKMQLAPELLEVQGMMPISDEDYSKLYKSISKVGIKDPLRGYLGEGRVFFILSGANRFDIATKLNLDMIPIEIYEGGSRKDRVEFALDENLERRHLTNDQKRKIAEWKLRNSPEESDRIIAKKAGVDHKTVGTIRKRLETGGEIPHLEKRRGQDGKIQAAKKSGEIPRIEKKLNALSPKERMLRINEIKAEIKNLEAQIKTKQKEIDELSRT
ncbi:hypothetical protein LEP1GSC096_0082 [Leptospira interrogans serovar Hebdomadis str. R499]|uniref:hypothetical protein n=1 Tax=Leptospira interrogans TaxID=173 RepID=UPI0002976835|nr:hypothetical protein [Leptospira interrogans]EKR34355.1 hypothetical protein LEP1GSC096_0082 [Leptospira interrogans serovar Hebdomadis str. R499]EMJ56539.1 hypothetical protein LEP1GSC111_1259 [Leptospira interrogans str. UT126]KGE21844.1 chromosomal partitioning protein ParB [Leptospira interrogans serovar Lai]